MEVDYKKLLKEMLLQSEEFCLVVRDTIELNRSGQKILERLQSYLVESTVTSGWPGTQLIVRAQEFKVAK